MLKRRETERLSTKSALPETNNQPVAKQKYLALWKRYSQGLTVSDPVRLDIQVVRRALKDGQAQKDIALTLSAGSSIVRRIIQDQGKQEAMIYVNQTVRKLLSHQSFRNGQLHQMRRDLQIELD